VSHRRSPIALFTLALCALIATTFSSTRAMARGSASVPTIEGPVTGGKGVPQIAATNFDLASVGYEQAEYFLSGEATAYTSSTPLASDGRWTVTPASRAPYKTRVVVYRPIDPETFSGTVVVEWDNVSGGVDAAPIWTASHDELVREGDAWVGVTAQQAGVEGGGLALVPRLDLEHADPDRYGSLVHPGDSYSYDMFTQAGRAVREPGARLLGGLKVRTVIGVGESQSAFRLTTYIDAVEPRTKGVYDGYLVFSRAAGGMPLSQEPLPSIPTESPTHIRADLTVPVLTLWTETDLAHGDAARQPDTGRFRSWEVAGTAHADTYTIAIGAQDQGKVSSDATLFAGLLNPPSSLYGGVISCDTPINSGPMTYVLRASIHALRKWIVDGAPPPKAPRIETTGNVDAPFALDAHGNVRGGIRTPPVDVPVATLSGLGQSGAGFCGIFGTTKPFDATTLATLYPSHAAFVKAWNAATNRAVKAGFVLPADAKDIKAVAAASNVGRS
jgi:hypothetical protein